VKNPPLVGVSACLLGRDVRHDGECKLTLHISDSLGSSVEFLPVCPEVEFGMSVPRAPVQLVQFEDELRLLTLDLSCDFTARMIDWAEKRLDQLAELGLCGFVFKSKSPSCALRELNVHDESGEIIRSDASGIFARMFLERFPDIPVEDELRLADPVIRESFISGVHVVHRRTN